MVWEATAFMAHLALSWLGVLVAWHIVAGAVSVGDLCFGWLACGLSFVSSACCCSFTHIVGCFSRVAAAADAVIVGFGLMVIAFHGLCVHFCWLTVSHRYHLRFVTVGLTSPFGACMDGLWVYLKYGFSWLL